MVQPTVQTEKSNNVEPLVESLSQVSEPTTVSRIDTNETLLESQPVVTTSTNTISTESGTTTITTRTITKHITKRIVKRIIDGREEIVEEDVIDDLPEENISVEQFDLPSVETTSSVPGSIIMPGLSSTLDTTVVQGGSITKTTITKTKRILKRITADGEEIVEEVYEDEPEVERDITLLPTTVLTSRNVTALDEPAESQADIIGAAQIAVEEIVDKAEQVLEPEPQKPLRKDKKDEDTVIVTETVKVEPEKKPQKPTRKDKKKHKKSESEEIKPKTDSPISQNVVEITEPQSQLETTEPLNTTSAITTDEKQTQSSDGSVISDDGSLIKTTVIRTTKIVKKINQQDSQDMSTSIHSDVASLDSYELAEEAAEEPKVEKSEMNSREVSDEGVVKTTKTTTIRTIKNAKAEPEKELVPEAITEVESTPEKKSDVDVSQTEDGSVLKTTIVRTTKIIKKITQDSETISEHSSASEPALETVETILQDAPIVAESVTTESNSEGITKTTTTRTTKAVVESAEIPAVAEPQQVADLLLITPKNYRGAGNDIVAEPYDANISNDVVKTTITRTTKIVKKVAQNVDKQSVSEVQETQTPDEPTPDAVEPTSEVAGGVTKTTTVRTTKIVKKLNEDDFPEVSLRVTETVTENLESLQKTAETSETSMIEFAESKPEVVETDSLKHQKKSKFLR
ncbi:protein hsr-9-like [Drosophila hydei]|uniref:Protein hsr-9-like n=1 Tax=Drosophila hydei TaxID=7224 RepID=A0A6J2T071_DROHY|nr:protein hsr-9-like [Drosophila hydei]